MYYSTLFITFLATASTAHAFNVNAAAADVKRAVNKVANSVGNIFQRDSCPSVWSDISSTLTAQYLADGQCTDAARAAIRAGKTYLNSLLSPFRLT